MAFGPGHLSFYRSPFFLLRRPFMEQYFLLQIYRFGVVLIIIVVEPSGMLRDRQQKSVLDCSHQRKGKRRRLDGATINLTRKTTPPIPSHPCPDLGLGFVIIGIVPDAALVILLVVSTADVPHYFSFHREFFQLRADQADKESWMGSRARARGSL